MNILQKNLKKQITLTVWMISLAIIFIGSWIVLKIYADKTGTYINGHWDYSTKDIFIEIFGSAMVVSGIAWFVLWIIGIVNAVKINKLVNGEATALVIFSVITLIIAGFITAVMARNKFSENKVEEEFVEVKKEKTTTSETQQLRNLKQAFIDGVITSEEYETKKAKINKKN